MEDMRKLLKQHIDSVSGKEAVFGLDDCTPWCATWVWMVTGVRVIDPDWQSWAEAKSKIEQAGSLSSLWDQTLAGTMMCETFSPVFGDIGVIETRVAGQVGGIFLDHGRFVWRVKDGVSILMPRTVVRAWTFAQ